MMENICNTSNWKKFLQINRKPISNPVEKMGQIYEQALHKGGGPN